VRMEARTGDDNPSELIEKVAGVKSVSATVDEGWHRCAIRVEANSDLREEIFRLAVARHWTVRELTQDKATLEDVFVEITHADN
jgi:ABC-type uncharacterized transport system ATPase subunit